jgi:hypothetical protein
MFASLATFVGIAASSVTIDVTDQSAAWAQWVVAGAAAIAAIFAAVIERPWIHGWLLQRQFDRPAYQRNRDTR